MSERDPLRQQILDRLGEELNPQIFEDAICDLLRVDFGTLVPIRGGNDAGMDGAIADGEGEAYPLIVTTDEDVIGNLTASLDSYLRSRGSRRKVVLATSRALTAQQRRNLETRAREKEFTLIQIYERRGIANLLYRDDRWRLALLGLSGSPEALSAVPLSRRPSFDLAPVGREGALNWLRTTSGDRILAGLPGAGKTFLLEHLIREGWSGLFLVSDDETRIANALRAQAPGFQVIVDDAHLDPAGLVRLRRLREEISASFDIVATAWEGRLEPVQEALPGTPVHSLRPLSRNDILAIYRQVGIREEEVGRGTLRELITQAANQPGLAVTLASLWLRGAWQEVMSGEALTRNLLEAVRDLIGDEALEPQLAAFALGGIPGIAFATVAEAFGIDRLTLGRQCAQLKAAGLLEPRGEALAVRLSAVRAVLLARVFFSEMPAPTPWRPLFDRAENPARALLSLLDARLRGVSVPDVALHKLVEAQSRQDPWRQMARDEGLPAELSAGSSTAPWRKLAWTSEENAYWVLDHYPGDFLHLAEALLSRVPDAVLPRIFERLAAEGTAISRWQEPLLQPLVVWLQRPLDDPEESLRRRRVLADEVCLYFGKGGSPIAALRALALVLSPRLEEESLDPGRGDTLQTRLGHLSASLAGDLEALVIRGLQKISVFPPEAWPDFERALDSCLVSGKRISEESAIRWREAAVRVMRQIAAQAANSLGLAAALATWGKRLSLTGLPAVDPEFELLYPDWSRHDQPGDDQDKLAALAHTFSREQPLAVALVLLGYEEEARKVGRPIWDARMFRMAELLAEQVENPIDWLAAFSSQASDWGTLLPFYRRILDQRPPGWKTAFEQGLADPEFQVKVASLAAKQDDLPADFAEQVVRLLLEQPGEIHSLVRRRRIALPLLHRLLAIPGPGALAAAVGEWAAEPRGAVREAVRPEWRHALLAGPAGSEQTLVQFDLQHLLTEGQGFAEEWLAARLERGAYPREVGERESWLTVLANLDADARQRSLDKLRPDEGLDRKILSALVGSDLEFYQKFLKRCDLASYHLLPLGRRPDSAWIPWALMALEVGYTPRELGRKMAGAACHGVWIGSGLEHWIAWDEAFAALEKDPRGEIREIGRAGRQGIAPRLEEARQRKESWALHGFYAEE